jgi:hypothetical protein
MPETWDDIVATINRRRELNDVAIMEMVEVRRRYNADWVVPMPDTQGEPQLPPITPALIAEAIDNVAMLATSVWPYMGSPPVDPSKEKGTRSREYADVRRKVLYGTWHESAGSLVLRRAYRHMAGYATACIMVRPDFGKGMPIIEIRDPLGTYPDPRAPEDLTPPDDCGYIYQRSARWLRDEYPHLRYENGGILGLGGDAELWDMLEWVDCHKTVVGVLGPREEGYESAEMWTKASGGLNPMQEVDRWENQIGICPVVTMPRVTLDRIASQVSHTVGMVDLMAKIMALALTAEERNVFADMYAVGSRTGAPTIVSNGGIWADGRTGQINLLENVDKIGQMQTGANQTAMQMLDRLERNFKVSGTGLVPAMGGETYGSLRTGRGIDAMMGAAVDPRVQELQDIMQNGMRHLNEIVFEMWKAYWPERQVVLQTGWASSALVEFTPKTHIEHTYNAVKYPVPGMSAESTTVTLGQLYGMGGMSMATLRRLHPWIDDPDMEGKLRDEEDLEFAIMESIKARASQGQLPEIYVAEIAQQRAKGLDVFAAVKAADKVVQEMQAAEAPPVDPAAGLMAPPETMPGISDPNSAAAALPAATEAPPTISEPNNEQAAFEQLAQALQAG